MSGSLCWVPVGMPLLTMESLGPVVVLVLVEVGADARPLVNCRGAMLGYFQWIQQCGFKWV